MANALDAVLQMKQQERVAQKAQGDSILMATQLFQQARQQVQENKFKELEINNNKSDDLLNLIRTQREDRLINQQKFSNSTKLRQEFINRPEVKDYMTVSPNVRSMESLLENAENGNIDNAVALDQGLITMYNKLTDPQSVVRESEYARTPENLPFVNRFQGAFQKLSSGGAGMTNDDRRALVQGAKIIANERGVSFQETMNQYKTTAADYGLDEKLITRDIPDFEKYNINIDKSDKKSNKEINKSFKSIKEAEAANLPKGTIITINGRKARID